MKVAFISYDFGEYCIRLASALAQKIRVCLILPHQLAAAHLDRLNPAVSFHPFRKPRLRQPLRQIEVIYAIHKYIKNYNPDLIHLQQGHLWFNFFLRLFARYPLILTIHDPRHHVGDRGGRKTPQAVFDFGFHRAAQIIVHGKQLKQVLIDEMEISSDIIHTIPMIVHGDDKAHSQIREEDHMILFFGRIWEYKGLEYLIRAEPLITAQVPDAKIVIAGQGEDFARYRRLMVHPDRFLVFNEYVSDDKRAELFRRASVVALPYIEASQSAVIPVAYTFAKPVVATTVGGLPEMVEHGRTGYLVPPQDEKALAEAVIRLLLNKDLRRKLGSNAKNKIDTECSAETIAQQTINVYRQVLHDGRRTCDPGQINNCNT
jgi:glycosyltransferase involved in cell wall biosynthesis